MQIAAEQLIPGPIALGALFTMDSLPGTPQIQNIIPTAFFKTDTWAMPWPGESGMLLIPAVTVSALAGIIGSASGGMSIALAAMVDTFIQATRAAVIPLLAATGLTHEQACGDIVMITGIC